MSLGEIFKKRRIEKHRSIEDVSLKLKISSRKIQTLENNDWPHSLAPVYARSYIAKYARFLSLDTQELLALYEQETKTTNTLIVLPKIVNPKLVLTPKTIFLFIVIIFFIFVGSYLIFDWINLTLPPTITLEEPTDNFITSIPEIVISGKTDSNSKLTINGAPVYPDGAGNFETTYFLEAGLNNIKIRAINNLGEESILYRWVLFRPEF